MPTQNLHLLAMPYLPPRTLPNLDNLEDGTILIYRRMPRRHNLRLELCLDAKGQSFPKNKLRRNLRKLSKRGIFDGFYKWPKSEYVPGLTDWTIYGRFSDYQDKRSDTLVITRDLVIHGQHDLEGNPILPQIKNTRYGTPLYQLNAEAMLLPVYLRSRLEPPSSAHERIRDIEKYGQHFRTILNLLQIHVPAQPEMTWLPPKTYM
jgi:hypothetical protein